MHLYCHPVVVFVSTSLLVAPTTTRRVGLTAKIPNDDDEEEANQAGMASAFRELEALDSLDDDDKSVPKKGASSIKGIDDLEDVKQLKNMKAPPEAEVKLYKDMMNESEKEDVELYVDMMTDMGGTTPKPKKKQTLQNTRRTSGIARFLGTITRGLECIHESSTPRSTQGSKE